jgi:hypothetical protein
MSNLNGTALLFTDRISKGSINEETLIGFLEQDDDFVGKMAKRISKEIYQKHEIDLKNDELWTLNLMIKDLFEVTGFIGCSSNYGDYSYEIIETEFEYVVVIATIV